MIYPPLPNIPWEERPVGCSDVVWRYHGPTIGIGYTFDFERFYFLENTLLPFNRNGVLLPRQVNSQYLLFSRPSDNGHTPFGDIYSPKWISTTYTLLTLVSIGIPPEYPAARQGAPLILNELLGETCNARFHQNLAVCDRCVVGMILQIAAYFGIEDDRIEGYRGKPVG